MPKSSKKPHLFKWWIAPCCLLALSACSDGGEQTTDRQRPPAPVETAPVENGLIRGQRTFSGTLEASEAFTVSPKVGGRIEAIFFDLGGFVLNNAIVARLDDAEFQQDVARAEADLLVARANFIESESSLTLTRRSIERAETLRERGVASEAELDTARSELLAQEARVEVFRAEIARAEAALESAQIQLSYTEVRAQWRGEGAERRVARRYADEGQNISANADLLEIVSINPIMAVFFVTERDYPSLRVGQSVDLRTDAHPGRSFGGQIARIAPVFESNSRQARIEVRIDNPEAALKPGMFARIGVEVARAEDATSVPYVALERRDDQTGVFLVSDDRSEAIWRTVEVGIREGERLQVMGDGLDGEVIVLGQQLVEDGSAISISESGPSADSAAPADNPGETP